MSTVGSYDARTHLANLLRRVAQGEEITITRRGVPVARLVPLGATEAQKTRTAREAIEAILELRKGHTLGGLTIRELIDEGRT